MRNALILGLIVLMSSPAAFAQKKGKKKKSKGATEEPFVLKNFTDSLSYAFGINMGQGLKNDFDSINSKAVVQGYLDYMKGVDSIMLIDPQMVQQQIALWVRDIKAEEGKKFLVENGKKDGVTTTASGLQYMVLKLGDGPKPTPTSKVKTHYHGTLIDGTVFDSSVQRGEPISFQLNRVIKGWQEGLQLMNVGSKYRFFIPYDLAYGERGAPGGKIKPFATLIFDVELLGIE